MQVSPRWRRRFELSGCREFQRRLGRRSEIRGATQQPWNTPGNGVEHLRRGVASRDALRIGWKRRQIAVPAGGMLAPLHLSDLDSEIRKLAAKCGEQVVPVFVRLSPASTESSGEMFAHAVGHEKLGLLRPVIGP